MTYFKVFKFHCALWCHLAHAHGSVIAETMGQGEVGEGMEWEAHGSCYGWL